MLAGEATPAQIGALLLGIQANGITADELTGVVRALLDACDGFSVDADAIDTCGTGGSMQRRHAAFNVSTLAAFVVAGAGGKVCKHGNRKASATSGSADLLEALGVNVELDGAGVARCVDEAGYGLHAGAAVPPRACVTPARSVVSSASAPCSTSPVRWPIQPA